MIILTEKKKPNIVEAGKASIVAVRRIVENLRRCEEQLEREERFFKPNYFVDEYESLRTIIDSIEDKLQGFELTR
jgi:hypothetical protein